MNLSQQFSKYDKTLEKQVPTYSGLLGLTISGNRQVNVENRAGFVYVRLRDNLSEVVQAMNDKVSPVYDFPVLIQRKGNRWIVVGRDDGRYETWGTNSSFLPAHGDQHSFNRDGGGGGDTVFVYPDQFMPLLVYPSGTYGAGNLLIAPYLLQRTSDYVYVGNTGTGNLLIYKPTTADAIIGLVYLNKTTGNPGVLIASGTPISASITGTAGIAPYIPLVTSDQEPLYAFRLVSGTTALVWSNLYNARQLVGGSSSSSSGISGISVWDEGVPQGTGTVLNFVGANVDVSVSGTVARVFVTGSAGGSSLPSFITGSIPFSNAAGTLTENNPYLRWENTLRGLRLGANANKFNFADIFPIGIVANNANEAVSLGILTYGTGSLGTPAPNFGGYRSRGTYLVPTPVQKDDALFSVIGNGYDGNDYLNVARIRFYADANFVTGTYTSTRMEFEVVPSGSATRRTQFTIYGDSVNQPTGSTYNIGGIPHTHSGMVTNGDSHDHAGGDGAPITDANLSTSDITTNDASTSKHGFLKKLSNVVTEFMNGQGSWSTPVRLQVFYPSGQNAQVPGSTTNYLNPYGLGLFVLAGRAMILTRPCVIKNLTTTLNAAQPAGGNLVCTVVDGAGTSLGITTTYTPGQSGVKQDTTNTYTVTQAMINAGIGITIKLANGSGSASGNIGAFGLELEYS